MNNGNPKKIYNYDKFERNRLFQYTIFTNSWQYFHYSFPKAEIEFSMLRWLKYFSKEHDVEMEVY